MHNEIAGTGLGLRIMQTIIDRHDGEVVIDSREGEGTTVRVCLTVHPDTIPAPLPHELLAAEVAAGADAGPADPTRPRIVPAFPRRG